MMVQATADAISHRVHGVKHGFGPMQQEATAILADTPAGEARELTQRLYQSSIHQARMVAVLIFGGLAAGGSESLAFLRHTVSDDPSWQVQEMLARAFDAYCRETGYERALPVIREWLQDSHPNVRRAAAEGLRVWTSRDYFTRHPESAVALLSELRADPSEYVRKSAGNSLRDISRHHPDLIRRELARCDTDDRHVAQTARLAGKFLDRNA